MNKLLSSLADKLLHENDCKDCKCRLRYETNKNKKL